MRRYTFAATALTLLLGVGFLANSRGLSAAPPDDEAKAIAVKVLDAGAAMFSAKDARGLAQTYADDGVVTLVTRDKDTGRVNKEIHRGRSDIEAYYHGLFKDDAQYHAKNTVEFARWVGHDAITITGHFVPDTSSGTPLKLPFVQTRVKDGELWRIIDLQVFFLPEG